MSQEAITQEITDVTTILSQAKNLVKKPYLQALDGYNVGKLYELEHYNLIGRDLDATICIRDKGVSKNHCVVEYVNEVYMIKDLGSRNGTYVDLHPIQMQQLEEGSCISIGLSTLLKFTYLSEQEVFLLSTVEGWTDEIRCSVASLSSGEDTDIIRFNHQDR